MFLGQTRCFCSLRHEGKTAGSVWEFDPLLHLESAVDLMSGPASQSTVARSQAENGRLFVLSGSIDGWRPGVTCTLFLCWNFLSDLGECSYFS